MRLPPTVHGEGDKWFMAMLVGIARDKGASAYIGDGSNRWPAVHRLDAAHLFRLALEQAPAGSVLHAVADEGVPIRSIAEVIGRHLDVPVVSISPEDAAGHFGWLAGLLGIDAPTSSALTRELLGWQPVQPGLIDDLEKGHYFSNPSRDACTAAPQTTQTAAPVPPHTGSPNSDANKISDNETGTCSRPKKRMDEPKGAFQHAYPFNHGGCSGARRLARPAAPGARRCSGPANPAPG